MKYETKANDMVNTDKVVKTENHYTQKHDMISCGLTKREYFAAMALQGMIQRADINDGKSSIKRMSANEAVDYADALIAALNAGGAL